MAIRQISLPTTGTNPKIADSDDLLGEVNASFTQTYADMDAGFASVQASLADGGRIADTLFGEPNTENFTTAFKTKLEGVQAEATKTTLQTDVLDATLGRAMRVGGFGLGTKSPELLMDINALDLETGVYRTNDETAGDFPPDQPGNHVFGSVHVVFNSAQNFRQVYFPVVSDQVWSRRYRDIDGGWQEWVALDSGEFGIGKITPPDIANIDVITPMETGVYRCTDAAGTFPPGNEASINFGSLLNISTSTESRRQIYCPATEDEIWARRYRETDGGFQEWKALHNPTPKMQKIDPPSGSFILSNTPMDGDSVLVYYDGVLQPELTITGSFIQMANGVSGVSEVWVHYWHF